jgi:hypothetical protein
MGDDHTEEYKGWSITVIICDRQLADTDARPFTLSVLIEQLQVPHRRLIGIARGAELLDRCDAIRHGMAAAKASIDAAAQQD